MSLQEKLNELKKQSSAKIPAPAREIMGQATRDLQDSKIVDKILKSGDKAPVFSLPDTQGNMISTQDLLYKGFLVVCFYRGVWWPYCNLELEALQAIHADIKTLGATLIVISPQLEKYSKQVSKKYNLTFPVLSDKENQVATSFGLTFELPMDLREIYSKFGIDLERFNGNTLWTLPMPGRFIIDKKGIIINAEADPDYTIRPEPKDILKILK
jgi:peroxiredoxin